MFYNPYIQRRDIRTICTRTIWNTAICRRCYSSCIRSLVTSVVVKADLKRIATGNSVKRTEIGRASVTIKSVVDFANAKSYARKNYLHKKSTRQLIMRN